MITGRHRAQGTGINRVQDTGYRETYCTRYREIHGTGYRIQEIHEDTGKHRVHYYQETWEQGTGINRVQDAGYRETYCTRYREIHGTGYRIQGDT